MQRGYQVIEPEALERWLPLVRKREFVVALLHWVVSQIRPELTRERPELYLEVILVTHVGTYPALGVRFADGVQADNLTYQGDDVEPRVQAMVQELMSTAKLGDFIDFATDPTADWSVINRDIPSPPPK